MKNIARTKEQLIEELEALRRRVAELEKLDAEHKRVGKVLLSEKDGLQVLMAGLSNTEIGVDIVGIDYRVLFQNETLRRKFGDLTGKLCYEGYMGLKEPCDSCPMIKAVGSKKLEKGELTGADGRDYELLAAQFVNPDGTVDKVIEVVIDITERKRAEQKLQQKNEQLEAQNEKLRVTNEELGAAEDELRASNEELQREITKRKGVEEKIEQVAGEWRTTFDAITDLVSIHDKDFRITRVNKAFADAFKMRPSELIGKTCYEIVHGTEGLVPNCPHRKTLETKEPAMGEIFEPRLGIYLEVTTSPIFDEKGEVVASVHVTRDVTERRQRQDSLIVTDRLASVGELASGIAHELNNPLTSVIGFSQLILDKDVPDDIREDVRIISSEAQRAAAVVKNLLTFARKHAPVKQLVNVNDIIEKVLELRAYEEKVNNIRVNTRFAADLPQVTADYFQLQQVFLNIIINAEYFMIEAHNKGTLTVTTERLGDIIRASLADDGPGILAENLGHLFDPFFTTKEVGQGTGLGLSICHGIITEHGGQVYAESELGKGATFIVELPVSDH